MCLIPHIFADVIVSRVIHQYIQRTLRRNVSTGERMNGWMRSKSMK